MIAETDGRSSVDLDPTVGQRLATGRSTDLGVPSATKGRGGLAGQGARSGVPPRQCPPATLGPLMDSALLSRGHA